MPAGPVTCTVTPSGASSRSWSRSSSTRSMLSVADVEVDGHGDERRGAVLGHDDRRLLRAAAVRRTGRGSALLTLGCALAAGLRQQRDGLLGELALDGPVELAGVGGPQHDGDLALVLGEPVGQLDRERAVGARGQGVGGGALALALGHDRDDRERDEERHQGDDPGRAADRRSPGPGRGCGVRTRCSSGDEVERQKSLVAVIANQVTYQVSGIMFRVASTAPPRRRRTDQRRSEDTRDRPAGRTRGPAVGRARPRAAAATHVARPARPRRSRGRRQPHGRRAGPG